MPYYQQIINNEGDILWETEVKGRFALKDEHESLQRLFSEIQDGEYTILSSELDSGISSKRKLLVKDGKVTLKQKPIKLTMWEMFKKLFTRGE